MSEDGGSQTDFRNYFNYFTEVEEHFQVARGTSLFLMSPLDWALVETWKNSGVPLEAVVRGIDLAFEKWRTKKKRTQMVNSLAYCAQAVMEEAQRMADGGEAKSSAGAAAPAFAEDELRRFLAGNEAAVRIAAAAAVEYGPVANQLQKILADVTGAAADLEALEQTLTTLEQKLVAIARVRQSDAEALKIRQELETYLRPWRSKMTAPQLAMLEARYLEQALLERAGLPRLSLFYLH